MDLRPATPEDFHRVEVETLVGKIMEQNLVISRYAEERKNDVAELNCARNLYRKLDDRFVAFMDGVDSSITEWVSSLRALSKTEDDDCLSVIALRTEIGMMTDRLFKDLRDRGYLK